ncbi:MAG TPA: alpha/beta hydrolase [Aggregatilineales bacterium]|nr:alpha/beta hydrolase [Aggregatilineales bacterium]
MFNRFAIDKTVTTGDLRFHYRDWGGRGWPVVLLHGLASTSHSWDLVAPLLVEHARVIALDLRGHGLSDKPDEGYDFETLSADVFEIASQLMADRPVVVGHGWGANVGLWMAAHASDELGGLVMVDGGVIDLEGLTWDEAQARLSLPDVDGTPLEAYRENLAQRSPQGLVTPAVEAATLASFEVDLEGRIARRLPGDAYTRILRALWETRLEPLYEEVVCPVLILPCRRDGDEAADPFSRKKAEGVRHAVRLMPDVEVHWLEDTVHDAPLQRPYGVAEAIIRFIQERV